MRMILDSVTYTYESPFMPHFTALQNVSFELRSNEILAIVGAAGSGKTTLIQHLNGLLKPTTGQVFIDDQDIHASKSTLSRIRQLMGLAFQFPEIQLFEETVFKDVAFGPHNLNLSPQEINERVAESLTLVGFDPEQIRDVSPFQLSGGEQRRVALAGIIAMDPEILALDEPTVGLDRRSTEMVQDILIQFHARGKSIVFISHDMDLVAKFAHRIIVLHKGHVLFHGSREDLFSNAPVLERAGLTMPRVCQQMQAYRAMGYPVRTNVFTVEDAKRELERVILAGLAPQTNKDS